MNAHFTDKEILNCIIKLKNNKAHGPDYIINEYIKVSKDLLIPIYVKLFNMVLDSGIIPAKWLIGIINPIYTNKGSRGDPVNYRGITILSCL